MQPVIRHPPLWRTERELGPQLRSGTAGVTAWSLVAGWAVGAIVVAMPLDPAACGKAALSRHVPCSIAPRSCRLREGGRVVRLAEGLPVGHGDQTGPVGYHLRP